MLVVPSALAEHGQQPCEFNGPISQYAGCCAELDMEDNGMCPLCEGWNRPPVPEALLEAWRFVC